MYDDSPEMNQKGPNSTESVEKRSVISDVELYLSRWVPCVTLVGKDRYPLRLCDDLG